MPVAAPFRIIGFMQLIARVVADLLLAIALLLQGPQPTQSDAFPRCPMDAERGPASELETAEIKPDDWHWYSLDIPEGRTSVLLAGSSDLEMYVCVVGESGPRCGAFTSYFPFAEGCFDSTGELYGRPGGIGRAIEGPLADVRVGIYNCGLSCDSTIGYSARYALRVDTEAP